MGRASLEGMLEVADRDAALRWHLGSNHFPPIPEVFDAALKAIEYANDEEWAMPIDLPAGVTWKGQTWATAEACVEAWHLDGFLDDA